MECIIQYREFIAVLIARVFVGFLFFFQGYEAVFKIKVKGVIEVYQNPFAFKGIPKLITACGAWFTSCSALICGFLLIIGLFQYCALYLLGLNLIITSIAFGIDTPMWDMRFVFPRLLLLLLLLLVPSSWHILSLDYVLFKN